MRFYGTANSQFRKGGDYPGRKLLALKLIDEDGVMYILPGGGQEGEELLPEAVEREALEETGLNVMPFYPSRLRRANMNVYEVKWQTPYLGNENMGDPEITN